jgi:serine/threonine protein phosphatase PrpC
VQIQIGARTDVGRMRTNNEDNFKLVPEIDLFVLSDGMGGEAHGEVASSLAVEGIAQHCLESLKSPGMPLLGTDRPDVTPRTNRLISALKFANERIYQTAAKNEGQKGMGATAVSAWVDGERLSVAHVGDSRIYMLRAGQFSQLTQDHSLVAEQVRRGILTQQQAEESDMASVLTRALGVEPEVDVDADEHILLPGDEILLCSDGLVRMVNDEEIASTLLLTPNPQEAVDRLIQMANENGGADNITVILLRFSKRSEGIFARIWQWLTSPVDSTSSERGN